MLIEKDVLENEKAFFRDYFNFRMKRINCVSQPDDWWMELVNEVDVMDKKYSTKFQRDLLVACVSDIERRARQANETAKEPT